MKAVNLLPSEHRGSPAAPTAAKAPSSGGSSFGAYAVLGLLALGLVMVAAYVLVGNSVKERQAELARVKAEAQTVRAEAAALKPFADFRELAVQRVTTVKQLADSRFDWQRALRDVSRALPADVHLRSFKGNVSQVAAGAAPGVAAPAPTIVLSGCTNTQSAVAKLMARLRAVRGVTRVSLTKSEKVAAAGGTPVSSSAQGPLCGRGSKPDFELTMHFERAVAPPTATVPAQPAPGQPAAGAAAQPAAGGQPAATPTPPSASGATTQGASTP